MLSQDKLTKAQANELVGISRTIATLLVVMAKEFCNTHDDAAADNDNEDEVHLQAMTVLLESIVFNVIRSYVEPEHRIPLVDAIASGVRVNLQNADDAT